MTAWPGYTPPATGSSQNDGTHPLTDYQAIQTAIQAQYTADGADTSQVPAQYYDAWTSQARNEPEFHAPTAPGKPTVATTGTAGEAQVTWTASTITPTGGYRVDASSGQSVTVANTVTTAVVTGLASATSVTFTVAAVGRFTEALSPESDPYTVP